MNIKAIASASVVFLCFCCTFIYSEDEADDNIIFEPFPKLFGADFRLGLKHLSLAEGLDSILWLKAGGSWGSESFYRNPDGSLYYDNAGSRLSTYPPDTAVSYDRLNFNWGIGFSQGILWNERVEENLLEAFIFYLGRYDYHYDDITRVQLITDSSLPDARGIFQNSVLAGFKLNDLNYDGRTKVYDGLSAEISAEWGPEWFFNTVFGRADFIRLNLTLMGFLPILDAAPESEWNKFSLYAAGFFAVDYIGGQAIPINVRKTIGGLYPRMGTGGAVRGMGAGRYDANLKIINNLELRANLPALLFKDLVPGFLVYFDSGFYSGIEGAPAGTPGSGFLFSTGAGVFINLFDLAVVTAYTHVLINNVKIDGSFWTPFSIAFSLHF